MSCWIYISLESISKATEPYPLTGWKEHKRVQIWYYETREQIPPMNPLLLTSPHLSTLGRGVGPHLKILRGYSYPQELLLAGIGVPHGDQTQVSCMQVKYPLYRLSSLCLHFEGID